MTKGMLKKSHELTWKNPKGKFFYMPVHIVYKESSTTTKIRAVFDASATTSSGASLNSILMVGTLMF